MCIELFSLTVREVTVLFLRRLPSSLCLSFTGCSTNGFVMLVLCCLILSTETPTKERPPALRNE